MFDGIGNRRACACEDCTRERESLDTPQNQSTSPDDWSPEKFSARFDMDITVQWADAEVIGLEADERWRADQATPEETSFANVVTKFVMALGSSPEARRRFLDRKPRS